MPSWLNWIYTDLDIDLTSCRFDDCLFGYTIFISIDLDYQYQWPSFQSCIESQTCRFPGLPLLGRQDAVAFSTNQAVTHTVMMPDANGLQLGNFWSPVAVASRHFHVCGSWLWDVLRCHHVLWLTRAHHSKMQIDARRALRSYDQLKLIARTSDPGLGWCNGPAGWNDGLIWYNYISTQIWGWNHSSRYLKMYLYQDVGCLILKGVRSSGFKRVVHQQPFAAKVQSKRLATSGILTVFCHKLCMSFWMSDTS